MATIICPFCPEEEGKQIRYDPQSIKVHVAAVHPYVLPVPDAVAPQEEEEEVDIAIDVAEEVANAIDAEEAAIEEEIIHYAGGRIVCDWCPETFDDLSASTQHIRLFHPEMLNPAAVTPVSALVPAPTAADTTTTSTSTSADAASSSNTSAPVASDVASSSEFSQQYLWSLDLFWA